jgi:CheY-like chemotaxis protein
MTAGKRFLILMADDDWDDCLVVKDALREAGLKHELRTVSGGEELLDYLHRRNGYEAPGAAPRPHLVLVDLNMPRKDGREALREMKTNPQWRRLPVVVLTTSTAEEDVRLSYELGANSYVAKPAAFRAWVDLVRKLDDYWFGLVTLPK